MSGHTPSELLDSVFVGDDRFIREDKVNEQIADLQRNLRHWREECGKAHARIAIVNEQKTVLIDALQGMTDHFKPFTCKPVGAPHSPARLDQEMQVQVHKAARAALTLAGEK